MGLLSADEAFFYLISYLSSLWNVGQKLNVTMPTRPAGRGTEGGRRTRRHSGDGRAFLSFHHARVDDDDDDGG